MRRGVGGRTAADGDAGFVSCRRSALIKTVWRSRFFEFCFRPRRSRVRKSLPQNRLHNVVPAGVPSFGDIIRVLSFTESQFHAKPRADHACSATKLGAILFHLVVYIGKEQVFGHRDHRGRGGSISRKVAKALRGAANGLETAPRGADKEPLCLVVPDCGSHPGLPTGSPKMWKERSSAPSSRGAPLLDRQAPAARGTLLTVVDLRSKCLTDYESNRGNRVRGCGVRRRPIDDERTALTKHLSTVWDSA
jgi:hypothetical protein